MRLSDERTEDALGQDGVLRCALDGCGRPVKVDGYRYCSMEHFWEGVRLFRLQNQMAGLCRCGQARDEGFVTCGRCRSRRREGERGRRRRQSEARMRTAVGDDVIYVAGGDGPDRRI